MKNKKTIRAVDSAPATPKNKPSEKTKFPAFYTAEERAHFLHTDWKDREETVKEMFLHTVPANGQFLARMKCEKESDAQHVLFFEVRLQSCYIEEDDEFYGYFIVYVPVVQWSNGQIGPIDDEPPEADYLIEREDEQQTPPVVL